MFIINIMREFQKLLGQKIKIFRKTSKLSQEQLAELLDISPTSVSNMETGKRSIGTKTMLKLSEIFKIEFYELFLFNNNKNQPKEKLLKQLYKNLESKNIKDNIKNILLLCELSEILKNNP